MCLAFPAYQKWMIKMKFSTVLLSSAALLVAGAAYAADLPAKKAAPAAAPTGCAAFGAGYIAVPGGDTCLKISGYVRANDTYLSNQARGTAPYGLAGNYGIQFDVQNQTEAGAVKSTIFIEDNATTDAYVSLGGLTAGKADDQFDIGGGYNHSGDAFGPHTGMIQYSTPVGSSTITVAATSAQNKNSTSTMAASRPDLELGFASTLGALKVNAGVVSHEVIGGSSGSAQGYAFIGKASYDAGVASIMGYAAYANGASKYLGAGALADSAPDTSALSNGTNYQGEIDVPVGKNDSIGLFGESISSKQDTTSYSKTQYAAALKHTIAKGLWIRPEIYTETINGTVGNGAYIRIERDF
jgi:hypothetical protein